MTAGMHGHHKHIRDHKHIREQNKSSLKQEGGGRVACYGSCACTHAQPLLLLAVALALAEALPLPETEALELADAVDVLPLPP